MKMLHSLRIGWRIAPVLGALSWACGCAPRPLKADASPLTGARPRTDNSIVAEATRDTAGGETCRLDGVTPLGPARKNAAFAAAFGEAWGLVAWQGRAALMARVLRGEGLPEGPAREWTTGLDTEPKAIVPLPGGFAVVLERPNTGPGVGLSSCSVPCSGRDQPMTCYGPCAKLWKRKLGVETSLVFVDGRGAASAPTTLELAGHSVAVLIPSEQATFALISDDGRWLSITLDQWEPVFHVEQRQAALLSYVIPVVGRGRPAALTFDNAGHWKRIDGQGDWTLEASRGPAGLTTSGGILDAQLLARWGNDGRIHVAWSAWRTALGATGEAVVENDAVTLVTQPSASGDSLLPKGGSPSLFRQVFAYPLQNGVFERRTWPTGTVGAPISLRSIDPELVSAHLEWTGSRFLALYLAGPDGQQTMRSLPVDCSR